MVVLGDFFPFGRNSILVSGVTEPAHTPSCSLSAVVQMQTVSQRFICFESFLPHLLVPFRRTVGEGVRGWSLKGILWRLQPCTGPLPHKQSVLQRSAAINWADCLCLPTMTASTPQRSRAQIKPVSLKMLLWNIFIAVKQKSLLRFLSLHLHHICWCLLSWCCCSDGCFLSQFGRHQDPLCVFKAGRGEGFNPPVSR